MKALFDILVGMFSVLVKNFLDWKTSHPDKGVNVKPTTEDIDRAKRINSTHSGSSDTTVS